jgi:undecaprenyl-diphosphatase
MNYERMGHWLPSLVEKLHGWDATLSQQVAGGTHGRWFALLGAHLGDNVLWLALAAWLWRTRRQQPTQRVTLLAWMATLVACAGITLGVKQLVQRPRPGTGDFLYGGGADRYSFPSGHALRVGAMAAWGTALWPTWGWLTWPLAFWVGWSRVRLGIHYAGDVGAGWLIGGALAALVRARLRSKG